MSRASCAIREVAYNAECKCCRSEMREVVGEVRHVEVRRQLLFCGLCQDCRLGMQKSWRSAHFGRLDRIRPTSIKRSYDNHPQLDRKPGLHTEGGIVVRSVCSRAQSRSCTLSGHHLLCSEHLLTTALADTFSTAIMGISRDTRHKRSASGAKRAYYRKKRYEKPDRIS